MSRTAVASGGVGSLDETGEGRRGLLLQASSECAAANGWFMCGEGNGKNERPMIWLLQVTVGSECPVPLEGGARRSSGAPRQVVSLIQKSKQQNIA